MDLSALETKLVAALEATNALLIKTAPYVPNELAGEMDRRLRDNELVVQEARQ